MKSFTCGSCGRKSKFSKQFVVDLFEARSDPPVDEVTRTYKCEHCGGPNRITLKGPQWMLVDAES